tara:strand:+ start:450 stop:713 length:264 start_codon:yes stop_codon:yes gene_type:complete
VKNKQLAVLVRSALATGCSSPKEKMRGEFLSGCAQSSADREFCNCVFDQLMQKFYVSYLERMNRTGVVSDEFVQANVEAGLWCNRIY